MMAVGLLMISFAGPPLVLCGFILYAEWKDRRVDRE